MGRSPRRWLLLRRWRHDLAPRHGARWRRSGGPADADIGAACVLLRSLQFGDIGGELVQALPHDSETVRDRSELIARSGEGRARLGRRDGRSRRGQPLKPWGQLGKRAWPYRRGTARPKWQQHRSRSRSESRRGRAGRV